MAASFGGTLILTVLNIIFTERILMPLQTRTALRNPELHARNDDDDNSYKLYSALKYNIHLDYVLVIHRTCC